MGEAWEDAKDTSIRIMCHFLSRLGPKQVYEPIFVI